MAYLNCGIPAEMGIKCLSSTLKIVIIIVVILPIVEGRERFFSQNERRRANSPSRTFAAPHWKLRQSPAVRPGLVKASACANGGSFLGSYCIEDYNCRPTVEETTTHKSAANVRTQEDEVCTNGGFLMSAGRCRHSDECNAEDPDRHNRGYTVIKCTEAGYCCSKPYRRPLQAGDPCLNGGRFIAGSPRCRDDAECASLNVVSNQQLGQGARTSPITNLAPVCVQDSCCTTPNSNLMGSSSLSIGSSDSSPSSSSYSSSSSTEEDVNYDRGRSACFNYGDYTGEICSQPTECGLNDPLRLGNYFCVSGFCCVDRSMVPGGNGGGLDYTQGDRVCAYRGMYLGMGCTDTRDCPSASSRNPYVQNLCINQRCCGIPIRPASGIGGKVLEVCATGPYRHYMGAGCSNTDECPTIYGGALYSVSVQCLGGYCCAMDMLPMLPPNYDPNQISPISGGVTLAGWSNRQPGSGAICYDGSPTTLECRAMTDCPLDMSCLNNLCCPKHPDERLFACGGLATNGNCFANSQCGNNLFCAASKLCCECRFGQPRASTAGIDCRNAEGQCGAGYYCNNGGFCCPYCEGGEPPFGTCYEGACGTGFVCQEGNICCDARFSRSRNAVARSSWPWAG